MIKNLKIKFVVIIMSIITIVLLCIFSAINILMFRSGKNQSYLIMHQIAMSDGKMPVNRKPNPLLEEKSTKMPQTYFLVKLNSEDQVIEIASRFNFTESEDITNLIQSALKEDKEQGYIDGFSFLVEPKSYGKIIVFLDTSMETNMSNRLLLTSGGIGILSLIVIFLISLYFSTWAVKPVKEAFDSQKQFVADASHELRTPLTVISTNADVLKSEIGNNKWLDFIKFEVEKMTSLVNNLLYLAKADSSENVYQMSEFNLSDAVTSVCLPFESVAFENNKNLSFDITDGILFKGDEKRIQQVVVILLDNAIKNSSDKGVIKVSLNIQNGKKVITVYNTGSGIDEKDKDKIFKRFYRSDSSRTRETGGYGLGLSIAKTIIDAHKGKITIEGEKGKWVSFKVTI